MISRFLMAVVAVSGITLYSCSKGGSKDVSSSTGWQYNNPDFGGFEYKSGYEQFKGPGLVFIEGGTFIMGRVEQDVMYEWNNQPRRVTVPSFYIDESEVSNANYREWLYWINRVFVDYLNVTFQNIGIMFWYNRLCFKQ